MPLDEIAAAVGGERVGPADLVVDAVATDSRQMPSGQVCFVALPGEHADGHDFVASAAEAGAAAGLVEHREALSQLPGVVVDDTWSALRRLAGEVRRRVDPFVVAITGSVGKTTTKDLTAAALGATQRTVAAKASFNNELGVPLTLLAARADTEAMVVEIGARGVGHIAALTPFVIPDVAIVTAVAGVHLELFGDIDAVARAKGELVAALDADGTAVLNGEDERVSAMADRTAADVLIYAITRKDADCRAEEVRLDRLARPSFTAVTPWGQAEVRLGVAGRHNVGNALAALAAACSAGVPLQAAAQALGSAAISSWRGEVHETDGLVILNDAYNANPTSVAAAVSMLTEVERTGQTWAVLGVMAEIGPTHDQQHRATGAGAVEAGVDHLIVVGEDARPMAAGARAAGGTDVRCVEDAHTALRLLREELRPGDVVLVKASRVGGLEVIAEGLLGDGDAT